MNTKPNRAYLPPASGNFAIPKKISASYYVFTAIPPIDELIYLSGTGVLIVLAIFIFRALKSSRTQAPGSANQVCLSTVIDHLDVGIITYNGTDKSRTYNVAAQKLLQCPDLTMYLDSFLKKVLTAGDHTDEYARTTDESCYIKMSGRRLPPRPGNAVSAVVLLQDISAEKKVEEELVEANRELDSFCYSISHDLRAPIRTINGFSRILLEDYGTKLDKEAVRLCNVIIKGGERMGKLIDDLLEFSRVSKHDISPSLLNMRALFRAAAAKLLSEEQRASVILKIHDLPKARGDQDLIMQVIMNLLSNAFKYSSRMPSPEIEVGGEVTGQEVTYYVKDNGVGFDMQYYDKLFEVFQRLHGRSEFEGTGVGLSIVDRIVKRHGGKVWAISSPGNGATFYFTLKKPLN